METNVMRESGPPSGRATHPGPSQIHLVTTGTVEEDLSLGGDAQVEEDSRTNVVIKRGLSRTQEEIEAKRKAKKSSNQSKAPYRKKRNGGMDTTTSKPSPTDLLKKRNGGTDIALTPGAVSVQKASPVVSINDHLETQNPKIQGGRMDAHQGTVAVQQDAKEAKQDESHEKYLICSGAYRQPINNCSDDGSCALSSSERDDIKNEGFQSSPMPMQQRSGPRSQTLDYPPGVDQNNVESVLSFEEGNESICYDQMDGAAPEASEGNEGLVEAKPVRDSQIFSADNMEVAEPVDSTTGNSGVLLHPGSRGQKRFSTKTCVLGLTFVLLLFVGFIIVSLVGRSSTKESHGQLRNITDPLKNQSIPTEHLMELLPASTQAAILEDPTNSSPQSKAYQWLRDDPSFDDYESSRLLQRYSMAALYYSLDGPNWSHQGGEVVTINNPKGKGGVTSYNVSAEKWLDYNSHECRWFGTSETQTKDTFCPQDNNTIISIVLWKNNLGGSLPEEVGLLTSLTKLHLHHNKVGGPIVSQLGKLTNLTRIYFMNNEFTGTVPTELAQLTKIERLALIANRLEGSSFPLKNWSMPSLLDYKVGRNGFLGGTIPENLSDHLPNLNNLIIGNIQLHGSIAPLIQCSNLEQIGAPKNQLMGSIPSKFGRLLNLNMLDLFDNHMTGLLPSELGLLSNLERVTLQGNSGLNGSLPEELGLLNQTLRELNIERTGISGTIPPPLCHIPALKFDCSPFLCGCTCQC